jgi:hypothetical protein
MPDQPRRRYDPPLFPNVLAGWRTLARHGARLISAFVESMLEPDAAACMCSVLNGLALVIAGVRRPSRGAMTRTDAPLVRSAR